jgi:hypothetical protein
VGFAFPQFTLKGGNVVILTCVDTLTGVTVAVQLPSKKVSEYASAEIRAFLMDAGRTTECIIQSDQEAAITALLRRVSGDLHNVKFRQSPAYSSESQGVVQRFHQTIQGQIRTYCQHLKEKVNIDTNSDSPLLPWIVRRSAWTVSRYLAHSSGKMTSYARRWGQSHASPICSFGEAVHFKISASRHAKLKSSWLTGVWLGKDASSNDHLVGCCQEVLRVRAIRMLPGESQWQQALLLEAKGTPDAPSGTGEVDTKFILGEQSLSFQAFKGKDRAEPLREGQATSSGGGSAISSGTGRRSGRSVSEVRR